MSELTQNAAPRLEADGGTRTPDPFITSEVQASNGVRPGPCLTRRTTRIGDARPARADTAGQTERPENAPSTDGDLPLFIEPTIAMRAGDTSVWQCSWCGCLLVLHHDHRRKPERGSCPGCDKPDAPWWRQDLPVGGVEVA